MRCLALANALRDRGGECTFVYRSIAPGLVERLMAAGHGVHRLGDESGNRLAQVVALGDPPHADWLGVDWRTDARDMIAAIGSGWDWLVVDHYALDARWHAALRGAARRILVIDDLGDRPLDCDALLDPNFRLPGHDPMAARIPPGCRRFDGPDHAPLDPSYADAHRTAHVRTGLSRVFAYLGAAPTDCMLSVLDALSGTSLRADAVVSDPGASLATHPGVLSGQIALHGPQPSLLPFMARADVAIGPIGSSTWERMCLGLPTIAVTMALNQETVARDLAGAGYIRLLGDVRKLRSGDYAAALSEFDKPGVVEEMSRRAFGLCDGRGAMRLARALV